MDSIQFRVALCFHLFIPLRTITITITITGTQRLLRCCVDVWCVTYGYSTGTPAGTSRVARYVNTAVGLLAHRLLLWAGS